MTNEIIAKLNRHIAMGLTTESDVVYVLVQLGKLIERENVARNYPLLKFYRNWVAHATLENVNANPEMKAILNRFDTIIQASQSGANVAGLAAKIADSISLKKLEDDINRLFDAFPQFNRAAVGRPEHWPDFDRLLLSILADITLQANSSYQFIKELKVDSANAQFDTLVVTPLSGQPIPVPLTR